MTLLMAMRAGDGIAAVADRKESLPGHAGREVTKCLLDAGGRFYISLSGDGLAARAILDSIGPSGPAWKISDLVEAMHEECHSDMSVDGILVVAAARGPEIYDIYIRDGQIDLYANDDAASVHGDYAAHVLCRHLAKGLDARYLSRGAAAAHLHVLASSVAETVDSVGRRDEYGFDLATIGAAAGGSAASLWRQADALGALEVRFRMSGAGGGRSAGGGGAHG